MALGEASWSFMPQLAVRFTCTSRGGAKVAGPARVMRGQSGVNAAAPSIIESEERLGEVDESHMLVTPEIARG